MKENDVRYDNQNILINDNNNACLKAVPYEQALQQNGWEKLQPISTALLPVKPFHVAQVLFVLGMVYL